MTTMGVWDMYDYLQDFEVRAYLKNVTVLEVLPTSNFTASTDSLQRLLCLMPNLLHLTTTKFVFQSTKIVLPICARPETVRKWFNNHNRGRKREEREERRQQRQEALERFKGQEHGRLSIPEVWQCRDLRTMVVDFSYFQNFFGAFTQYVGHHGLLRNLTLLSISINALRVGQLRILPFDHPARCIPPKLPRKFQSRKRAYTQAPKAKAELPPPGRWENDFLLLRGLRCLEQLDITTQTIVGTVHATDFEFLRKQSHSHVMLFIADKNKDAGPDKDEDSGKTERCGRLKDRTFWPHLLSMYVRYRATEISTDFDAVVDGIEQIRPGVEFVIRKLVS